MSSPNCVWAVTAVVVMSIYLDTYCRWEIWQTSHLGKPGMIVTVAVVTGVIFTLILSVLCSSRNSSSSSSSNSSSCSNRCSIYLDTYCRRESWQTSHWGSPEMLPLLSLACQCCHSRSCCCWQCCHSYSVGGWSSVRIPVATRCWCYDCSQL